MEKYKILDKKTIHYITSTGKKAYRYLIHIKCNDCGNERWANAASKDVKKGICRKCNEIKSLQNILNLENENFKVIGLDKNSKENNGKHAKFFVQCKKCNKIYSRRASVIRQMLKSHQCNNCKRLRLNKPLNVLQYKLYCAYKSGAKARNLEWNLTEADFLKLIKSNCKYCGCEPHKKQKVYYELRKKEFELVNGIDRIDSTKGYTLDNCVSCCEQCNKMKLTYSVKDFLNKVKDIYDFSIKRSTTISKESTSEANADGKGELLNAT